MIFIACNKVPYGEKKTKKHLSANGEQLQINY